MREAKFRESKQRARTTFVVVKKSKGKRFRGRSGSVVRKPIKASSPQPSDL